MELIFTKRAGKTDLLVMRAPDTVDTVIACPKQRIIPHDMMHYAVESTLSARGFLSRVAVGEAAGFTMVGNDESDGVERLVEVFQGDGWSNADASEDDLLDLYRVTCDTRGCTMLPLDRSGVRAIRERISELDAAWSALPVGGTMSLILHHP